MARGTVAAGRRVSQCRMPGTSIMTQDACGCKPLAEGARGGRDGPWVVPHGSLFGCVVRDRWVDQSGPHGYLVHFGPLDRM